LFQIKIIHYVLCGSLRKDILSVELANSDGGRGADPLLVLLPSKAEKIGGQPPDFDLLQEAAENVVNSTRFFLSTV
jgi:hypothetical protein